MQTETLTSDLNQFKEQLEKPNQPFNLTSPQGNVVQIRKNLILSFPSDQTGCGHIRNYFVMSYLNAIFGKSGQLNTAVVPFFCFQEDVLMHARSIFFQRQMAPQQLPAIQHYKTLQEKFKYKMIWDLDDFIYSGPDKGECIPEYNFGSAGISDEVRKTSIEVMNLMDVVTVSTEFLGKYIKEKCGVKTEIKIVPNSVPMYFWGPPRNKNIDKKIEKPKLLYSGSPTHYRNDLKLPGDFENAWMEYVIKNIKENKIDMFCMGGLPYFFEEIKDKENFHVINWLNSYQFHSPIIDYKPDFGIAPLVPNYFNYSKSFIKYEEYCAVGAAGIGTVFTNGFPSPYDVCRIKMRDTCTVKDIEETIDYYSYPEHYNLVIKEQNEWMINEGLYLESPKYINYLTQIY